MNRFRKLVFLAALCLVAACASTPEAPTGPPDYSAVSTRPNARAALYADCIGQAAMADRYGHARDPDTNLILFTCTGAPARAFYEGLAARSAAVGSEFAFEGRTYRSTNPVIANLFGVDYCSTDGADFTCVITLNAGDFLAESAD